MTQPGYRHIIFINDRSGSMEKILAGMQSGFEEFTKEQAAQPGRVTASLWQYDTEIECVHSFAPLEILASYKIIPRGRTAMYDAIVQAVTVEGEKLAALPEGERPEDVTAIITSDGLENASIEYGRNKGGGPRVAAMLTHQREVYGWTVIYMGTNQDAFAESAKVGIPSDSALSY